MSSLTPEQCIEYLKTFKGEEDFIQKNGAWLLTVIASGSMCLGLCFTYFLKSRCKNIKTPCVSCQRDVLELEAQDMEVSVKK